jgi:hypothetical protein
VGMYEVNTALEWVMLSLINNRLNQWGQILHTQRQVFEIWRQKREEISKNRKEQKKPLGIWDTIKQTIICSIKVQEREHREKSKNSFSKKSNGWKLPNLRSNTNLGLERSKLPNRFNSNFTEYNVNRYKTDYLPSLTSSIKAVCHFLNKILPLFKKWKKRKKENRKN